SPTAKTSKLEVSLPTDTPFTSVSVKPVEGWTAQVITTDLPKPVTVSGTTVTKAPTSVVWTADEAHQLGQNQYQSFSLAVGTLPVEGTKVTLKAVQTYTDGNVVNWDEESAEGQPEPRTRPRPSSPRLTTRRLRPPHQLHPPRPQRPKPRRSPATAAPYGALSWAPRASSWVQSRWAWSWLAAAPAPPPTRLPFKGWGGASAPPQPLRVTRIGRA
ncbi:YcnI family protein, partial [Pseudarthrobacter sp. NPDC080037]